MAIPVKDWGSCLTGPNHDVATLACIPTVLANIINVLLGAAGIVAVFVIALAGFKYITSQGDQARLDSARKTFLWAIVGLIFIFFSYFFISLIGKFTGVTQIPH